MSANPVMVAAFVSRHPMSAGRRQSLQAYRLYTVNPEYPDGARLRTAYDVWTKSYTVCKMNPDAIFAILPVAMLRALAGIVAKESPYTEVVQFVSVEEGVWRRVVGKDEDQWQVWTPEEVRER